MGPEPLPDHGGLAQASSTLCHPRRPHRLLHSFHISIFCVSFAVNGPLSLPSDQVHAFDLTHPVDFALSTHQPAHIPPKQLTSTKIHHQSCGTKLWRWVLADLHAAEANLAMVSTNQSWPRANERLWQTSYNI